MTTLFMTGATGFAGRTVVDYVLKATDWNIVSFQRELRKISYNTDRVLEIQWDFREKYDKYMSPPALGESDRFFLHLGAEVHAVRSLIDPQAFVKANIVGTANVLDVALFAKVALFAYVSTGEVFGGRDTGYSKEDDPLRPSNPYAATKAAGELLTHSYHRAFGLPTIIVRTMNIYSMDQNDPSKFVPIVRNCLETGETLKIHTKLGKPGVRQWLHVTAFAMQLVDLLRMGMVGETYHLIGEELSSLDMAQRVANEMGKPLNYERIRLPKTHEHRYAMEATK